LKRRSLLKRNGASLGVQVAIDSKEVHDPYTRLPRQTPKRLLCQPPFPHPLLDSPRRTPAIPPGLSSSRDQLDTLTNMGRECLCKMEDTASIYSVASAPVDLHDQILLSQPSSEALCNYQHTILPGVRSARTLVGVAKATNIIPPPPPTTQRASIEELPLETYRYRGSGLSATSPFQDPTGSSDVLGHQWYVPHPSESTAKGLLPEHLRLPAVGLVSPIPVAREGPRLHRRFCSRLPSPYSPPPL
jgi:hypothetical protein